MAAVAIAVPTEQDAALVSQALAAGNHVFAEKPPALRHAEQAKLVARGRAAGTHLRVGHLLKYHPTFIRMQELVRQGALGSASLSREGAARDEH